MVPAAEAIRGQESAHSLAMGPVIADPFISPLGLTMTPALSSKYTQVPSLRRNDFLWRTTMAGITVERKENNRQLRVTTGVDSPENRHISTHIPLVNTAVVVAVLRKGGRRKLTLLAEGRGTLLDSGHDHVAGAGGREPTQHTHVSTQLEHGATEHPRGLPRCCFKSQTELNPAPPFLRNTAADRGFPRLSHGNPSARPTKIPTTLPRHQPRSLSPVTAALSPPVSLAKKRRENSEGVASPVENTTVALDGHDVQVLGTGVVGTVHNGGDRQTKGHAELVTTGTSTSTR